jgi:hypothetical protein
MRVGEPRRSSVGNEVKRFEAQIGVDSVMRPVMVNCVYASAFDAQSAEIVRLRAELQKTHDAGRVMVEECDRILHESNATIARLEAEARGRATLLKEVEILEYALRDIHNDLSPRCPNNKYPPKFKVACETVERAIQAVNELRDAEVLAALPPASKEK